MEVGSGACGSQLTNFFFLCLAFVQDLALNYSHVRKTRGDGNCFYRAFGYAYLEVLIGNQVEYDR